MARTRETSIVESEMTEGETAGNVIGRGFSVLSVTPQPAPDALEAYCALG